jgi:peptidoglycan/LPS O-acetylase OafA/YrhL
LEDYIPSEVESSRLENLCREGSAARTVTLALSVLAAVVLYGVVWRTFRRHQAKQVLPSRAALQRVMRKRSTASDERTVVEDEMGEEKVEK